MVYTLEMYLASVRDGQWFAFSNHNDKSYSNLIVHEGNSKPTEQECIDGIAALQAAYDSSAYARNRITSYPALAEQLDLLFHDMTAGKGTKTGEWYKAVKKVKTDNPKG